MRIFSIILLLLTAVSICRADDLPVLPENQSALSLPSFKALENAQPESNWGSTDPAVFRIHPEAIGLDGENRRNSVYIGYQLPDAMSPANDEKSWEAVLNTAELDASEYDHLTLLIKGNAEAGFNRQITIGLHNRLPDHSGFEIKARIVVSDIKAEWQRVTLPLNQMTGNLSRNRLGQLSISLPDRDTRIRRGGYSIAEISLIKTGSPGPYANEQVEAYRKNAWDSAQGGGMAAHMALKNRLNGWPAQSLKNGKQLPDDNHEFLMQLARDTWHGLDMLSDRENGLPLDRIHLEKGSTAPETALIGDYTSVTNIGFHFLSIISAYELGLIDRGNALEKLKTTLGSLEKMETYRGFFYNYYNTTSLERTSNFISFVDSSWLTAGLLTLRSAFPELVQRCNELLKQEDYRFFYDPQMKQMSHGYYVDRNERASYHYGSLYSEARLGSLIAIGKGDVPAEHWFAMYRTYPNEVTWQTRQPVNRHEKIKNAFRWSDGYYQWREFKYIPSWGGSMFEALMPGLLLEENRYAPASLGQNSLVHTDIQRVYAREDLDYPVWGMSPSSVPNTSRYDEFGVRILGSMGYKDGVVTPHAAALALITRPEEATENLKVLRQRYDAYGELGFYDAIEPRSGQVAWKYLCLNQAMILVSLANHLANHAIQNHFAADPWIQNIIPLLGIENFFD
ncbi:glucoamylase family protein [Candidatus Methylospira mobilis]|nr:glucoamylase family protein [Candidatus Methylospira mobilis]WNV03117.1 glucoamylase family protein [Candidatus Methylospira mobilis]